MRIDYMDLEENDQKLANETALSIKVIRELLRTDSAQSSVQSPVGYLEEGTLPTGETQYKKASCTQKKDIPS